MRLKTRNKGFSLIELLIVVAIIGIIAAIAIPNLLNAIQRAKQKRSMADMRSIGEAVETYQVDLNFYPKAGDITALKTILEANDYMKKVPTQDGWGNNFIYRYQSVALPQQYTIRSTGKDGTEQACSGKITRFDQDIVFSNGQFICWPEGVQKQ